jgi:hypothetical protein
MRKKGLHLDSLVQKLFGWDLNPQIDALTERRFTIKLPKITPPSGSTAPAESTDPWRNRTSWHPSNRFLPSV